MRAQAASVPDLDQGALAAEWRAWYQLLAAAADQGAPEGSVLAPAPDVQASLVRSEAGLPVELGQDVRECRGRSAEDHQAGPDPDVREVRHQSRGRSAVG
jgi:hypothetical protein